MRQRSVQMRLEELNSFACPLAFTIVACGRNRRGASVLPRMFRNSFLEPRCMYCASAAVHVHAKRSFHLALVRWWHVANWQFFHLTRISHWIALSRPCVGTTASQCVQPRIPQDKKTGVILAYMCVKLLVRLYVCHRVGPFWVHFGSILGPFWVHFGSIWGPFGVHLGSIWGPFGVHFAYCLNVDAS